MSSLAQIDMTLIRQLCSARPGQLPRIFVHDDVVWLDRGGATAPMKIDCHGNLHMAASDMLVLKTMLPVRELQRVRVDMIEFKLEILPHHLLGGVHDRAKPVETLKDAKNVLRDRVDPDDGEFIH